MQSLNECVSKGFERIWPISLCVQKNSMCSLWGNLNHFYFLFRKTACEICETHFIFRKIACAICETYFILFSEKQPVQFLWDPFYFLIRKTACAICETHFIFCSEKQLVQFVRPILFSVQKNSLCNLWDPFYFLFSKNNKCSLWGKYQRESEPFYFLFRRMTVAKLVSDLTVTGWHWEGSGGPGKAEWWCEEAQANSQRPARDLAAHRVHAACRDPGQQDWVAGWGLPGGGWSGSDWSRPQLLGSWRQGRWPTLTGRIANPGLFMKSICCMEQAC